MMVAALKPITLLWHRCWSNNFKEWRYEIFLTIWKLYFFKFVLFSIRLKCSWCMTYTPTMLFQVYCPIYASYRLVSKQCPTPIITLQILKKVLLYNLLLIFQYWHGWHYIKTDDIFLQAFSTVCQLHWGNGSMIMTGFVQQNLFFGWKEFHIQQDLNSDLLTLSGQNQIKWNIIMHHFVSILYRSASWMLFLWMKIVQNIKLSFQQKCVTRN